MWLMKSWWTGGPRERTKRDKREKSNWRTEEIHDAGNDKGVFFIWGGAGVLETWDLNIEQYRKAAAATQNAIQACCDMTGLFFKRVDRIASSQKPEPVPSTSDSQFSRSVMSDSLRPHGLQHARLLCPSPTPGACSNPCPSSWSSHPTISSSGVPFSSCLQPFPEPGSFPMSQFFASGGQRFGVSASASVLSMNIQHWFPLGWTGWTSLQSKGLSRVFSNTTVQKHQFFTSGASEITACPPSPIVMILQLYQVPPPLPPSVKKLFLPVLLMPAPVCHLSHCIRTVDANTFKAVTSYLSPSLLGQ